jgi:hypothetical protein
LFLLIIYLRYIFQLLKRTIRVDHVQDYKPPKAPKKKPGENEEKLSDIPPQGTLPPVKLGM